MRDLDSAVGRLDNLFMSLYVVVAILIIAVTLVGAPFCVELTWIKLFCLGSRTCYLSHRDWQFDPRYVMFLNIFIHPRIS